MKNLFFIIVLVVFTQSVNAQGTVFEEGRTIYKKENAFGVLIHTRGWGLTYKYGKYTSGFTRRTYEGELVGMKHPKEVKTFSDFVENTNGYIYGMLNSILIFRGSIGNHKTFISKQSIRGISISSVFNVGISVAYAKPVFLEISIIDEVTGLPDSKIEKYDPDVHKREDILGKASWFRGLFNGKFYPGVYLKGGLSFESSRQANKINALEVGGILDLYFQNVPIMANNFNKPYFFNLYVSLTFGSKKTE